MTTHEAKWIDISPLVSEESANFPGFPTYRRVVDHDFKKGNCLRHSKMECSLHVGAHADAPSHYHPDGEAIDSRSLAPYFGKCQVLQVKLDVARSIEIRDLKNRKIEAPRVLFRTDSFPDPNRWTSEFASLSPSLIAHLADQGVILVGIDTPSIDPASSQRLESHQMVYQRNLSILEGLDLKETTDKCYTLIALPLRLKGADASPVRAILVP